MSRKVALTSEQETNLLKVYIETGGNQRETARRTGYSRNLVQRIVTERGGRDLVVREAARARKETRQAVAGHFDAQGKWVAWLVKSTMALDKRAMVEQEKFLVESEEERGEAVRLRALSERMEEDNPKVAESLRKEARTHDRESRSLRREYLKYCNSREARENEKWRAELLNPGMITQRELEQLLLDLDQIVQDVVGDYPDRHAKLYGLIGMRFTGIGIERKEAAEMLYSQAITVQAGRGEQ